MLLDIVRLPKPIGTPIDTRKVVITSNTLPTNLQTNNFLHWPSIQTDQPPIVLGSKVDTKIPYDLYKTIHLSKDESYVFETVFNVDHKETLCLYTKLTSIDKSIIGISPRAVSRYSDTNTPVCSITNFIGEEVPMGHRSPGESIVVPPIFGEDATFDYVRCLSEDYLDGKMNWKFLSQYHPILKHNLPVFIALYEEKYLRSPLIELQTIHPMVQIYHNRWFMYEELNFKDEVCELSIYPNHELFRDLVVRIMTSCPLNMNVSMSLLNIMSGNNTLGMLGHYDDPFRSIFQHHCDDQEKRILTLRSLFVEVVSTYIRSYSLDVSRIIDHRSSVTISKNSYEEIAITIKDEFNNNHLCFYYSLPILMMSTMAVGWYL